MEERVFRTKVGTEFHTEKTGKTVIRNDYILGCINGIMTVVCEQWAKATYVMRENILTKEIILTVKCTPEQYENFKTFVDERYPGLCKFYV